TVRSPFRLPRPRALASIATSLLLAACGGGGTGGPSEPFVAHFPVPPPTDGAPPPAPLPPPSFPQTPVWTPNAVDLERVATFGSFPSDVVAFDDTVFTTDADAIEAAGVRVVAVDVSGSAPAPSTTYATTTIHASDLVDSNGNPGDISHPVGF